MLSWLSSLAVLVLCLISPLKLSVLLLLVFWLYLYVCLYLYLCLCVFSYLYLYVYWLPSLNTDLYRLPRLWPEPPADASVAPHGPTESRRAAQRQPSPTASLRTKILDFRGFDSSIILILRCGILMSTGNLPEKFESKNRGRDNLSREIGRTPLRPEMDVRTCAWILLLLLLLLLFTITITNTITITWSARIRTPITARVLAKVI